MEGWLEVLEPCLRETKEHANFLFLFAKNILPADHFKNNSTRRLLSDYMSISLEAFAVVMYANR